MKSDKLSSPRTRLSSAGRSRGSGSMDDLYGSFWEPRPSAAKERKTLSVAFALEPPSEDGRTGSAQYEDGWDGIGQQPAAISNGDVAGPREAPRSDSMDGLYGDSWDGVGTRPDASVQ